MGKRLNRTKMITETIGDVPYSFYPMGEHIVRAPDICGGRPTFKYTRIEITFILNLLASGKTIDEIVAEYENRITSDAILEAIRLVTDNFNESLPVAETA